MQVHQQPAADLPLLQAIQGSKTTEQRALLLSLQGLHLCLARLYPYHWTGLAGVTAQSLTAEVVAAKLPNCPSLVPAVTIRWAYMALPLLSSSAARHHLSPTLHPKQRQRKGATEPCYFCLLPHCFYFASACCVVHCCCASVLPVVLLFLIQPLPGHLPWGLGIVVSGFTMVLFWQLLLCWFLAVSFAAIQMVRVLQYTQHIFGVVSQQL